MLATMASLWGASLVLAAGCVPVEVVDGGDAPAGSGGAGGMAGGSAGDAGVGGTGAGGTGAGGTGAGGSCSAFEPSADCSPLGHYKVVETGPPDSWIPDGVGGPFEITVTDDCGKPKAEGYKSSFFPATCTLRGERLTAESCYDVEGNPFCTYEYQRFELSFASSPATGTVRHWCEGECGYDGTAPIEAVKQQP